MLAALLLFAAGALAGPIEDAFRSVLENPPPDATAEALAASMTQDQKALARDRLQPLRPELRDAGLRLLAENLGDAYRGELAKQLPQPAAETTTAASQAWERGDNETAARLAAEALARDPTDEKAFGILKLSERKVKPVAIEAAALPVGFAAPPNVAPTPAAVAHMRQAVAARRAGNMDAALRSALDAMRADPTSPDVQDFYRVVISDRARQARRARAILSLLEQAADALEDGRAADADRLARQAAELDPLAAAYLARLREALEQRKAMRSEAPEKKDEPAPLWPLAALLGTLGAGAAALAFRGKVWIEDHPVAAVALGVAALAGAFWLAAGGGAGLLFAPVGKTAAPAAVAAAGGIGTAKTGAAVGAVAAPLLMSGDAGRLSDERIEELEKEANSSDPADQGGKLTKVGRSLVKHSDRPGTRFKKPSGNPDEINRQARELLHEIMHDRAAVRFETKRNWGEIIEIEGRNGFKVRFTSDGKFMYLKE